MFLSDLKKLLRTQKLGILDQITCAPKMHECTPYISVHILQ
jgi:hypothetical protein